MRSYSLLFIVGLNLLLLVSDGLRICGRGRRDGPKFGALLLFVRQTLPNLRRRNQACPGI